MTSSRTSAGLDPRRKRLLFRAWHRGIREMDLLLGQFADAHIESLSEAELERLQTLMELPDPVLYGWLTGVEPPPPDADLALIRQIADFYTSPAARAFKP